MIQILNKYGSVKVINRIKKLSLKEGIAYINSSQYKEEMPSFFRFKDRLDCFIKNDFTCVSCNLKANFFSIEEIISTSYQGKIINLYGDIDNKLIFFTKDHIFPKSKGGLDSPENYQTMCWECNSRKGNKIL